MNNNKEYIKLKTIILNYAVSCSVCQKTEAHDIHILKHYIGDDLTLDDVIPVCSDCQTLIDRAISSRYIDPMRSAVPHVKTQILDLYQNEEFLIHYDWFTSKHYLNEYLLELIKTSSKFVIRAIIKMTKKKIWYDDIHTHKFTGKQIVMIRGILKTEMHRKHKL